MSKGEMVLFENSEEPITLEVVGDEDAVFVIGSGVPHPHDMHMGSYSVHTTAEALVAGESRIRELRREMQAAGDRKRKSGAVPVFK